MAKSYLELQKQIAALTAQAEKARQSEVAGVVARIKEAIAVYGITLADLNLDGSMPTQRASAPIQVVSRKKAAAGRASVARYQDGSGNSWSGRGPRPRWLREALASGATLESFTVNA